ncbi:MAG: PKD domain-containing protein [Solirubrobacteraceae bacterium]|nr:PKD domain-containing protein [Solirubrobacteraceae bacterium]
MSRRSRLAAFALAIGISLAAPATAPAAGGTCTDPDIRPQALTGSDDVFTATSTGEVATQDGQTAFSPASISADGLVRWVRVEVTELDHADDGELSLTLRAPDGTRVKLAEARPGTNYAATVFRDDATSILSPGASAPYTGSFAPQEPLNGLYEHPIQGEWRLEVADAAGGASGRIVSWTLQVRRHPCGPAPTAAFSISPDVRWVTPGGSLAFDASESTGTSGAATTRYEWDLDGDGMYETDGGAGATIAPTFAGPRRTIAVGLRVTDGTGATDERTTAIAVTDPPVASFIPPPSPLSLDDAVVDASASTGDPAGALVRYEWDLDGDGTYELDVGTQAASTVRFATSGQRTVRLRVTDDVGATSVASASVDVQNRPPTADVALVDQPAVIGVAATLDASASQDADGTIASYDWDLDGDGTYETAGGAAATIAKTFADGAPHTVGVRVTDNLGATAIDTVTVSATSAPIADGTATPSDVRPGETVTFDPGGSYDPDGSIVAYRWDFDGDGVVDHDSATPDPVGHAYPAFGAVTAKLTVVDDRGATAVKHFAISVANKLPVARIAATPSPAATGEVVRFSAVGSYDPDGSGVTFAWDLDGDGGFETSTGTTATASRSYPNRLRATIRVRVTDADGAHAVASLALAVDPPAESGHDGGSGTGGTPGGAGGAGSSPGGGAGSAAFSASLLGTPIQPLRTALRRGVSVSCRASAGTTCSLEVLVGARDARRLRLTRGAKARRPVRVARAKIRLSGAGTAVRRLRLTGKARRALRRARGVVLVVRGSATGPGGRRVTLSRAVLLR